jgi:hypothetical protein
MADDDDRGGMKLVPPDLKSIVDATDELEAAYLPDYHAGTELWVTTASGHVYYIILLDEQPEGDKWARCRLCRVTGGLLPEPREMVIAGSTLGGSTLRSGQVVCGMLLELAVRGESTVLTTTTIVSVSVKPFDASREPVQ